MDRLFEKYAKYVDEMIKTGNDPIDFEQFKKMIEESEKSNMATGGRVGLADGTMMASAPDPMDERNTVMENIAIKEFGKPLDQLSDDEIIQIGKIDSLETNNKLTLSQNFIITAFDSGVYYISPIVLSVYTLYSHI